MLQAVFGITLLVLWVGTLLRLNPRVLVQMTQATERLGPSVPHRDPPGPFVSVVIAARNEEKHISNTLSSLKAQTYKALEVILVDDRSEDATSSIIQECQQSWPTLRTIRIEALPPGWLGKNHALFEGAASAKGEWILFTDADIYFYPDAVERAVNYISHNNVDHLTVPPAMLHRNYWLSALISLFSFNLMIVFLPHLTLLRGVRTFVGVGAFNLIRQSTYRQIGTHAAFPMRPDDDLFLGKLVKEHGFRQSFAPMHRFIEVEWYPSVRAMMNGLEKNALTPFDFSTLKMSLALLGAFLFYEGPFLGLLCHNHLARMSCLLAIVFMYTTYISVRAFVPVRHRYFIAFPIVTLLFLFILVRALWLFVVRGGITWRGTFYTKEELLHMRHEDH